MDLGERVNGMILRFVSLNHGPCGMLYIELGKTEVVGGIHWVGVR